MQAGHLLSRRDWFGTTLRKRIARISKEPKAGKRTGLTDFLS